MRQKIFIITLLMILLTILPVFISPAQSPVLAAENYTVTFDSQGGTPVASITVPAQGTISLPNPPTKPGYQFLSWNTWPNGNAETLTENTVINGNTTVYAQWSICRYIIRFIDWNDNLLLEDIYNFDEFVCQPLNIPTREGFLFDRWDKPVQRVSADETYKAVYIPMPVPSITSSMYKIILIDNSDYILIPPGKTAAEVLAGVNTPREFMIVRDNNDNTVPDSQTVKQYDRVNYFAEVLYNDGNRLFRASDSLIINILGDVNLDSSVNDDDRRELMLNFLRRGTLQPMGLISADINVDGVVNVSDLLLIKQRQFKASSSQLLTASMNISLKPSASAVKVGDALMLTLYLQSDVPVAALDLRIEYDENILDCVTFRELEPLATEFEILTDERRDDNCLQVVYLDSQGGQSGIRNGDFFMFKFLIKPGQTGKTADINVNIRSACDAQARAIQTSGSSVQIPIGKTTLTLEPADDNDPQNPDLTQEETFPATISEASTTASDDVETSESTSYETGNPEPSTKTTGNTYETEAKTNANQSQNPANFWGPVIAGTVLFDAAVAVYILKKRRG